MVKYPQISQVSAEEGTMVLVNRLCFFQFWHLADCHLSLLLDLLELLL